MKCTACGQPEGTGTLLEFQPDPPVDPVTNRLRCDRETWARFAARYRCPVCASLNLVAGEPWMREESE